MAQSVDKEKKILAESTDQPCTLVGQLVLVCFGLLMCTDTFWHTTNIQEGVLFPRKPEFRTWSMKCTVCRPCKISRNAVFSSFPNRERKCLFSKIAHTLT